MKIKNFLHIIAFIDFIIIYILFFKIDFKLIFLDFIFSIILLVDIFWDLKTKKQSTKTKITNTILILSCIPYDLINYVYPCSNFSIFKVLRLIKIIKLITNLIINTLYPPIKSKLLEKEVHETINKKDIIPYVVAALIMCIISISVFEDIGLFDSFYFVIVSFASVGYGDIVMHHPLGRIITIFIAILSIIGIGLISSTFIDYLSIKNNKIDNLEKEINELKKTIK